MNNGDINSNIEADSNAAAAAKKNPPNQFKIENNGRTSGVELAVACNCYATLGV